MKKSLSAELAEGFAWIESFTNFERQHADSLRPFRLDRMRALAELFGNPQRDYPSIHVAGSKGKGSTCAFIAAILAQEGFRTAVYASPHVYSYRERFLLNSEFLSDELLTQTIQDIRERLVNFRFDDDSEPTTFELLTLTGMTAFSRAGCDWAVFETGLGGRLDATNILSPRLSVITSIELEHTRILGSTLKEVAAEKGGIIKSGVPVLLGEPGAEAAAVLEEIARERGAPLFRSADLPLRYTSSGHIEFTLPGGGADDPELTISALPGMPGRHQGRNALTAARAVQLVLAGTGSPSAESCSRGIACARLPGRFEIVVDGGRPWVYDAAHTPVSAAGTAQTFRALYPQGGVAILGVSAEKDLRGIASALPKGLSGVIVTRPGSFRISSPEETLDAVREFYPEAELRANAAEAVERALELAAEGEAILVTGSFYLLGSIRDKAGAAGAK
jgi:dihydrofolate synthase / folylpolyglutamate synthase